jgi:hypothetical protein
VRRRLLLWFGVLGAPVAWTFQHLAGYALTEAACHEAGTMWKVAVVTWTLALTAGAAAIAVLAGLAAIATWRATRGASDESPTARMHFMAVMGMTLTPLFLMIILMSGIGVAAIGGCAR